MVHAIPMFGRRQRRESGPKLPVLIVTGFLGAGKTTLVKALLDDPRTSDTAVIVNEFGEIGIDDSLLISDDGTTVLLDRGCLCCRVRTDLQEALRDLVRKRALGDIPAFERIVIETSGLVDPGPVMQTLLADQGLLKELYLLAAVCVVDAAVWVEGLVENAPEAARQLALSDRVVISKADLIDDADMTAVLAQVSGINPAAPVSIGAKTAVETGFLFDDTGRPLASVPLYAEEVRHLPDIQSFSLVLDKPLNWEGFSRALEALRALRGPDLLRVKGMLAVRGCPGPVIVHCVQHLAHPPVELAAWPTDDRRSRLVFVTRGLPRTLVTSLIEGLSALAGNEDIV
jgi:G3E family GTPase